jgi:hypothetical protein
MRYKIVNDTFEHMIRDNQPPESRTYFSIGSRELWAYESAAAAQTFNFPLEIAGETLDTLIDGIKRDLFAPAL